MSMTTPPVDRRDEDAPGTVNARFARHLDRVNPPSAQRRRVAVAASVLTAALLLTAAAVVVALWLRLPPVWAAVPLGLFIAARAGWLIRSENEWRRRDERTRRVIQHGVPVIGYVVSAPDDLSRPGAGDRNCQVLFSFQPEVASDEGYMRWLAARVRQMRTASPRDADGRYVAALSAPDPDAARPAPYRRRRLPLSFTDGSTVFCADLFVRRAYLKNGRLSADRLPCVAEPGEAGGIELVPVWLATGNTPPPGDGAAASADKRSVPGD